MRVTFFLLFFIPMACFAETTLEKRAAVLYQEVRCPVCLGQSIEDSETNEAQALKTWIFKKLKNGESEDDIREKLRLMLGDDILLRPPFEAHTLFLWLAPFGLFLLVLFALAWKVMEGNPLTRIRHNSK